jgi:hypothetical protein
MGLLSNDLVAFLLTIGLLVAFYYQYFLKKVSKKVKEKSIRAFPLRARPVLAPPIFFGCAPRSLIHMDILSLNKYVPKNVVVPSMSAENTKNNVKFKVKTPAAPRPSIVKTNTAAAAPAGNEEIFKKIIYPYMPGCEPDSANAVELHEKFPELTRPDIIRFLVARKGNIKAAEEMIVKCMQWRASKFPLKRPEVKAAFQTKCFFPYGRAKDGSPVVYMRGGLYDSNKATPEQFVMAAAYTIEWSLRQCPGKHL